MLYLGEAIRIIRKKFHETQQTMATKLSITSVYLSYLETNKFMPSLRLIGKIEEIYVYNVYVLAYLIKNGKDSTIKNINKLHFLTIEDYSGTKISDSQLDN